MNAAGWFQLLLFIAALAAVTKPMGVYLMFILDSERKTFIERVAYKICRIDPDAEHDWKGYATAVLVFSFVTMFFTYALLRLQAVLPLNPQKFPAVSADLAFNTAASFTTNTNWQSYAGESTMSYFSQMVALASHNFWSAAVGISVSATLVRGLVRASARTIGNFWVDLVRVIYYLLLPLCMVFALVLISQGVVQNFKPYDVAAQGPMASQVAIKMLGTNGGGFTNANAAHPFENPTPLSNFLQMLAIFAIPAGLTYYLGRMVKNQAHGWAIWCAMFVIFLGGVLVVWHYEATGTPILPNGNMEGKEVRFGIFNSALFATVTTGASCGAVNAMHDSFTPLGGLVLLLNMQLGEIVFGGVGSGIYGMFVFVVLSVFIAGLMVGRTPEILGKKIEPYDVKMAALVVLILAACALGFTAFACLNKSGAPHGFSEILYAYSSCTANNGSAFAGLNTNTILYNTTLAFAMLLGRFAVIVPILALAGSLARKKLVPPSAGTFPVSGSLFTALLIGVILIVGALNFFPALALGPIVEHFLMYAGKLF